MSELVLIDVYLCSGDAANVHSVIIFKQWKDLNSSHTYLQCTIQFTTITTLINFVHNSYCQLFFIKQSPKQLLN